MLTVTDLHKSFETAGQPLPVLRGVDLAVTGGECVALTGESGSGKSTLLHLIAALDTFDAGSIRLDGQELAGLNDRARADLRRNRVGVIFQQFNLIPSLCVGDNLAFQARLAGRFDAAWQARLTERLGLSALTDRWPEQLSGGQQQRVAVGRAIAARPVLVLADEPTGNLDEATGGAVMDLLLDLVAETQATLLMVTHSAALAARLDRRVHLSLGQVSAL
ncbi:ABC transporter ATP-binding protein [Pontivivens nitratireducens]|uniref:ABC transporter ATP-binding protein n=1 Tax=Pontivivens nitratireducens TaxID=2758038 RepID=A0A6G7VJT7_9RHOB|nr:ABC transporter ATP-binding protein [Pontibrevibacter nitratireducens]QIK40264.1 ABC transporter ATP-binding protein [Pontibrevibacter nitratireducens]